MIDMLDEAAVPNDKRDRKPIRMALYSITPKGKTLLNC
jgi:hypothetical protein